MVREAKKVVAPFTRKQVKSLNDYQASPLHPYTCGNDSTHRPLRAYRAGLFCPDCSYQQTWVWSPMLDRTWEKWLLQNLPGALNRGNVSIGREGRA